MKATFLRRMAAEFLGTLLLLAAVVGSGIMGEHLAGATWRLRCWRTHWRRAPF
jgi:glycerol uptake facilitator-like aquaporin